MRLFTDMSVIDQYFINQSIELANNMTYMREANPCLPDLYQPQSTCHFLPLRSWIWEIFVVPMNFSLVWNYWMIQVQCLTCQTTSCRPARQLARTGIHLQVKQRHLKEFRSIFGGDYLINFWCHQNFARYCRNPQQQTCCKATPFNR